MTGRHPSAFADLERGWHLRGVDLPWDVGEPFMRSVLRAVCNIRADVPLKPHARLMALLAIHEGIWQAERPGWVDPSRSADGCNSACGAGSGTLAPVSAATSGGGVRDGRPLRSGWPCDGLDSAWSMIRVLAEDRFLDSHTVMIAPDGRPYSLFEKHYRSARGHM